MKQYIAHINILVKDYDEAIEFYTKKLNFNLIEDTKISNEKRWVLVTPPGSKACGLVLAKATNEEQSKSVGNQAGGKVLLFLFTDDIWRDYQQMINKEINFVQSPKKLEHGTVAIFEDLYGNKWDFIEPNQVNF